MHLVAARCLEVFNNSEVGLAGGHVLLVSLIEGEVCHRVANYLAVLDCASAHADVLEFEARFRRVREHLGFISRSSD